MTNEREKRKKDHRPNRWVWVESRVDRWVRRWRTWESSSWMSFLVGNTIIVFFSVSWCRYLYGNYVFDVNTRQMFKQRKNKLFFLDQPYVTSNSILKTHKKMKEKKVSLYFQIALNVMQLKLYLIVVQLDHFFLSLRSVTFEWIFHHLPRRKFAAQKMSDHVGCKKKYNKVRVECLYQKWSTKQAKKKQSQHSLHFLLSYFNFPLNYKIFLFFLSPLYSLCCVCYEEIAKRVERLIVNLFFLHKIHSYEPLTFYMLKIKANLWASFPFRHVKNFEIESESEILFHCWWRSIFASSFWCVFLSLTSHFFSSKNRVFNVGNNNEKKTSKVNWEAQKKNHSNNHRMNYELMRDWLCCSWTLSFQFNFAFM